ncbi:hypothetical protein DFJ74DRAFT_643126 [Hyaloraphidium curvatum]|nr:hypothetical protein DFJ74DRAFT_643126 [Hyaloraphidium curvatum]
MTRCMFGPVWIEDPHHPVIQALRQQDRALVLEVETEGQLAQAVAFLGKAKRDELGAEGSANPGAGRGAAKPVLKALSAAMELIGSRLDKVKDFRDQAEAACKLIRRAAGGGEPTELELGLAALPAVVDRITAGMPPSTDPWHAFAVKHFGPIVLGELETAKERKEWRLDDATERGWGRVREKLAGMGHMV